MSRATVKAAIGLLLLTAIAGPAAAAEGRTPIHASGTIISADGKYVLTRNILNVGGGSAITISAPFVDLDLNGMVVTQANAGAAVIAITGGSLRVKIHDGSLYGGATGIHAPGGVNSVVVEDVLVHAPAGPGVHLGDVSSADLRRIHVTGSTGTGILWDGANLKTGVSEDNSIRGASDGIIVDVRSEAVSIRNNRIAYVGLGGVGNGVGISLGSGYGSEIVGNIISNAFGEAILVRQSWGGRVTGNSVVGAGAHGIHIDGGSSDILISDNVVRGSGSGHGIFVEGYRNQILRNTINLNAGGGLVFNGNQAPGAACGNTLGGNQFRFNQGAGLPVCTGGTPPDYCDGAVGCGLLPNTSYGDNLAPGPPPS